MTQYYQEILAPVDGSKNAEHALKQAVQIAKRNNSRLEILNVIDIRNFTNAFGSMLDMNGDIVYSTFNSVESYLNKLKQAIKQQANFENVRIHARFGSPRVVIANDFLTDYAIDLIVMGKTGSNPVERFLTGSVTDYVTRNAKCDIIIIHK
ncbi:universal stress protein [Liquorilactobacillus sicerae]|uniref:universal stress protein n=1 Tax=Liquorilactobacillus sicerae TaxID=1416943 RepID=UPI00248099E1|nr:universal stress protein [Liquorilactobacillus sicerae]